MSNPLILMALAYLSIYIYSLVYPGVSFLGTLLFNLSGNLMLSEIKKYYIKRETVSRVGYFIKARFIIPVFYPTIRSLLVGSDSVFFSAFSY